MGAFLARPARVAAVAAIFSRLSNTPLRLDPPPPVYIEDFTISTPLVTLAQAPLHNVNATTTTSSQALALISSDSGEHNANPLYNFAALFTFIQAVLLILESFAPTGSAPAEFFRVYRFVVSMATVAYSLLAGFGLQFTPLREGFWPILIAVALTVWRRKARAAHMRHVFVQVREADLPPRKFQMVDNSAQTDGQDWDIFQDAQEEWDRDAFQRLSSAITTAQDTIKKQDQKLSMADTHIRNAYTQASKHERENKALLKQLKDADDRLQDTKSMYEDRIIFLRNREKVIEKTLQDVAKKNREEVLATVAVKLQKIKALSRQNVQKDFTIQRSKWESSEQNKRLLQKDEMLRNYSKKIHGLRQKSQRTEREVYEKDWELAVKRWQLRKMAPAGTLSDLNAKISTLETQLSMQATAPAHTGINPVDYQELKEAYDATVEENVRVTGRNARLSEENDGLVEEIEFLFNDCEEYTKEIKDLRENADERLKTTSEVQTKLQNKVREVLMDRFDLSYLDADYLLARGELIDYNDSQKGHQERGNLEKVDDGESRKLNNSNDPSATQPNVGTALDQADSESSARSDEPRLTTVLDRSPASNDDDAKESAGTDDSDPHAHKKGISLNDGVSPHEKDLSSSRALDSDESSNLSASTSNVGASEEQAHDRDAEKSAVTPPTIVIVKNLDPNTHIRSLRDDFAEVGGEVRDCSIVQSHPTTTAHISFDTRIGAQHAIWTFDNQMYDGQLLDVSFQDDESDMDDDQESEDGYSSERSDDDQDESDHGFDGSDDDKHDSDGHHDSNDNDDSDDSDDDEDPNDDLDRLLNEEFEKEYAKDAMKDREAVEVQDDQIDPALISGGETGSASARENQDELVTEEKKPGQDEVESYIVIAKNFGPGTKEEDIETMMDETIGEVLRCVLLSSKPMIAEITFACLADAKKAVVGYDGKDDGGHKLEVYHTDRQGADQVKENIIAARPKKGNMRVDRIRAQRAAFMAPTGQQTSVNQPAPISAPTTAATSPAVPVPDVTAPVATPAASTPTASTVPAAAPPQAGASTPSNTVCFWKGHDFDANGNMTATYPCSNGTNCQGDATMYDHKGVVPLPTNGNARVWLYGGVNEDSDRSQKVKARKRELCFACWKAHPDFRPTRP